MSTAINNPLYGVELGSIVTDSGGFSATVANAGISRFDKQESGFSSMSGTSSYVYSDTMNQGSFSVAGSYGLSGVAKVSAAVTGYVGNTTAKSGNELKINLNLIKWAGIEYIAFNDLTPAELIAGLQSNPQQEVETVLDAYLTMSSTGGDEATAAWVKAVADFNRMFGAGIVVGVLWGGWGAVSLKFTADSHESKWEGGGNAQFSYKGPTAAVDVAATYGHTEDSLGKDASAQLDVYTNGACVKDDINKWRDDLLAKATAGLQALGKEPVISGAAMSGPIKPPTIPSFEKPQASDGLAKKVSSIDSLDGLKAYAIASAYDKDQKAGGKKTLDEFIKDADSKNDTSGIPTSGVSPKPGDDAIVSEDASDTDELLTPSPATAAPSRPPADMSAYEPLGVWTVGWGQLFPWLATGHDNRIPPDGAFRDVIKLRTLHQDCLSLGALYLRIAAAGPLLYASDDGVSVNFESIGNQFTNAAEKIGDFLAATKATDLPAKAAKQIQDRFHELNKDEITIYNTWVKVPALRRCELGAGIVLRNEKTRWAPVSIASLSAQGHDFPTETWGRTTPIPTGFDVTVGNHTDFGQTVKGWPVVLPDGRIVVFVCDGVKESSGFLTQMGGDPFLGATQRVYADKGRYVQDATSQHSWPVPVPDTVSVSWADRTAIVFEPNVDGTYLNGFYRGEDSNVDGFWAFPIPFDAAEGVTDWKGSSLTTGMGNLEHVLDALRTDLGARNQWTLDDATWADVDWKDYRYSVQGLQPTYAGVVDEVKSVFHATPGS